MEPKAMEVAALLGRWPVARGGAVRGMVGGTNNLSWRVEAPGGEFVLRVYVNTGDPELVAYEHAMLERLGGVGLSFGIAVPVRAEGGQTLVLTGSGAQAALYPLLPGRHPEPRDPEDARAAGRALGELDRILDSCGAGLGQSPLGTYGDLDQVHPLVDDPLALPGRLPVPEGQREEFGELLGRVSARVPALYGELPRQLIHSDFCRPNVLLKGGRASGVLDFEWAADDLRAMDLAVGLYHFGFAAGEEGLSWDWGVLRAFAEGYGEWVRPTREEVEALPDLMRLRRAVSVIHWAGRWLAGVTPGEKLGWQVGDTLELDRWLGGHGSELVEVVWERVQGSDTRSSAE